MAGACWKCGELFEKVVTFRALRGLHTKETVSLETFNSKAGYK